MIGLLQDMHRNLTGYLNETIEHIYAVLPGYYRPIAGRPVRGLFDFGGEIFRGVFGTMSETDREHIESQLRRIGQTQVRLADAFSTESGKMASYFAAANHRMDAISKLVVDQRQLVIDIFNEATQRAADTTSMHAVLGTAVSRLANFTVIMDHINEIRLGVERLIEGYLTPPLVPPVNLVKAMRSIVTELDRRFPGMKLLWDRPTAVYSHANQVFVRQRNKLLILVKFPVSVTHLKFNEYEFKSFPVTIPSNEKHVTQIAGLPFAIVVHLRYDYFITLPSKI
jgi:hypothetical protein